MSFVKLDCGILDSTLWASRPQLLIFLTALLKAKPWEFRGPIPEIAPDSTKPTGYVVDPGWYGFVESSGPGLVRLALNTAVGLEFEEGMNALASLAQPEATSRSSAFEGRRMLRVDRGYLILNLMRYRDHDGNAAVRMKALRQRRKGQADPTSVTEHVPQCSGTVTETEVRGQRSLKESTLRVDVDAERVDPPPAIRVLDNEAKDGTSSERVPFSEIVAIFHDKLSALPKVEKLTQARRGSIRQRWTEDLPTLDAWANYFEDVASSDFLMGRAAPTAGRPPFRASLEWLCKPANFAKVLEGNYHRG